MINVYNCGTIYYFIPDCTVCKACHKQIGDVGECPFPLDGRNKDECDTDCEYFEEIWDKKELLKELSLRQKETECETI